MFVYVYVCNYKGKSTIRSLGICFDFHALTFFLLTSDETYTVKLIKKSIIGFLNNIFIYFYFLISLELLRKNQNCNFQYFNSTFNYFYIFVIIFVFLDLIGKLLFFFLRKC